MASNIWLAENRVNHLFDIWNTLKFLYPLEMRNQEQRTEELLSLLLCSPDDLSIYEIPYIIAEDFSDADWIPLYRKHFADILQCWADNQASN
ncbi:hypothetical protein CHU32_23020 [Superficieibacter electus]|uniref:Uncharacterized protein n=2 Tax=Superficieibacter electus TaxID=2022662 RepID=A0A2P5GJ32_9ENTR|nr:hypothetical protein CHU33_23510 [Superficieibacter electus]POP43547.1 hypothetical protein CHU32_23020 [Superficieibacter electus]